MQEKPTLTIALCSFDPGQKSHAENLIRCREYARKAKEQGAEWLAFPEMTLSGFEMQNAKNASSAEAGQSDYDGFSQMAQDLSIGIAAGLIHGCAAAKPLNQLILWDDSGIEIARYSKIHPFSLGQEHEYFESGNALATAKLPQTELGLSICYDLRFGEIFRALSKSPIMLNIACWPERRQSHWELLCAARALENRCYFAGVNRTGTDSIGLHYAECSGIWDPNGQRLTPTFTDGPLKVYKVDLGFIRKARLSLPALKDRRPELYQDWL